MCSSWKVHRRKGKNAFCLQFVQLGWALCKAGPVHPSTGFCGLCNTACHGLEPTPRVQARTHWDLVCCVERISPSETDMSVTLELGRSAAGFRLGCYRHHLSIMSD